MTAPRIGVGMLRPASKELLLLHEMKIFSIYFRFSVDEPDEKPPISGERYMTICGYKANGERQSCPPEDRYPWLGDHCGGNTPCQDCEDDRM